MLPEDIRKILLDVQTNMKTVEQAVQELKTLPFETVNSSMVDHHRQLRTGFPEVIFGESKTVEQIAEIAEAIARKNQNVLITRINPEKAARIIQDFSSAKVRYNETARAVFIQKTHISELPGNIMIICAGSSDKPVADEAAFTAENYGAKIEVVYDAGVAGLHRLLSFQKKMEEATVIIAIAGMEGALPSVIAGLVSSPVIAVPTSVGYGTNFGGISALLTMLNSCSSTVSVVNIDNGFGAAQSSCAILRKLI